MAAALLALVAVRAYCIPITHDEASTFFFYVQADSYMPYTSHAYTNNHVLNSLLASQCYKLWGSHPFVLRLPNILSFVVMAFAVYRISRRLRTMSSKVLLCALLFLTLNMLDFFSLCRGYGMSLAFLLLGISFLLDFFDSGGLWRSALALLCLQLALAANLALLLPLVILAVALCAQQISSGRFLSAGNLLLHMVNAWLLWKWLKVALWYKELNLLDSGSQVDFYSTTFVGLMEMLFNTSHWLLQSLLAASVLICSAQACRLVLQSPRIQQAFSAPVFFIALFWVFVVSFLGLNLLLGVNYPDNRMALFFYLFFALAFVFCMDSLPGSLSGVTSLVLAVANLAVFACTLSFDHFVYHFYHVMPDRFLVLMKREQEKSPQKLTVGGHMNREMNFAFANFREGSPLNSMDVVPQMHMNCDLYYARKSEYAFYDPYYEEIAEDAFRRTLLRRRSPLVRDKVSASDSLVRFEGSEEFVPLQAWDGAFIRHGSCHEARVRLHFEKIPVPFNGFVVLESRDSLDRTVQYRPLKLNYLATDLNGHASDLVLTSQPLQKDTRRLLLYIWNPGKHEIKLSLTRVQLDVLSGDGVNVAVPASFYESDSIRHKHL